MKKIKKWENDDKSATKFAIICLVIILFVAIIAAAGNGNTTYTSHKSIYIDGKYCVVCGNKAVGQSHGNYYCARHNPH